MTDYASLRARHGEGFVEAVVEAIEHLRWSREELEVAQTEALREIVSLARARSGWHHARLTHVDVDTLDARDLASLPTMTKDDLMTSWDEIVTDPRLTLDEVNRHLESISTDAYLFDEYHAVASGGSSGTRGVFAWGWEPWRAAAVGTIRWSMRYSFEHPETLGRMLVATVAASAPTHMSSAMAATFAPPEASVSLPVLMPIADIVDRMNELQPTQLRGYASALFELAREQLAGRLRISPFMVMPDGEPLLPEMRATMERAWNVPVGNVYGTSEGGTAACSCLIGSGMHLNEDLLLVEPVDDDGQPVAPGELSSKILLTNLFNPLLPLIRYEITDQVRILTDPCPCGCAFRRIDDVQGRLDHVFRYGEVAIHPHVFRSPLSRSPEILEYQVRQTASGADIDVRVDSDIASEALAQEIAHHLEEAGLARPSVTVNRVDAIERTPAGKQRRFIPLP